MFASLCCCLLKKISLYLGKPNREYCTWILNEEHWGGAIELAILSKHFKTEMVAVDTQNERLNRFGEDENYGQRILLIYDGIHYDPLLLEYSDGSGIRTTFSTDDHMVSIKHQPSDLLLITILFATTIIHEYIHEKLRSVDVFIINSYHRNHRYNVRFFQLSMSSKRATQNALYFTFFFRLLYLAIVNYFVVPFTDFSLGFRGGPRSKKVRSIYRCTELYVALP